MNNAMWMSLLLLAGSTWADSNTVPLDAQQSAACAYQLEELDQAYYVSRQYQPELICTQALRGATAQLDTLLDGSARYQTTDFKRFSAYLPGPIQQQATQINDPNTPYMLEMWATLPSGVKGASKLIRGPAAYSVQILTFDSPQQAMEVMVYKKTDRKVSRKIAFGPSLQILRSDVPQGLQLDEIDVLKDNMLIMWGHLYRPDKVPAAEADAELKLGIQRLLIY